MVSKTVAGWGRAGRVAGLDGVGVLLCRCVGVLVYSIGMLVCWCVGVLVCRSAGVLECLCVGVLERRSVGVLELVLVCWSVGCGYGEATARPLAK